MAATTTGNPAPIRPEKRPGNGPGNRAVSAREDGPETARDPGARSAGPRHLDLADVRCAHCGRRVGIVTFGNGTRLIDPRPIATARGPAFAFHEGPPGGGGGGGRATG